MVKYGEYASAADFVENEVLSALNGFYDSSSYGEEMCLILETAGFIGSDSNLTDAGYERAQSFVIALFDRTPDSTTLWAAKYVVAELTTVAEKLMIETECSYDDPQGLTLGPHGKRLVALLEACDTQTVRELTLRGWIVPDSVDSRRLTRKGFRALVNADSVHDQHGSPYWDPDWAWVTLQSFCHYCDVDVPDVSHIAPLPSSMVRWNRWMPHVSIKALNVLAESELIVNGLFTVRCVAALERLVDHSGEFAGQTGCVNAIEMLAVVMGALNTVEDLSKAV